MGLIGDAIRDNPGYIQLRRLEAARNIASTLSKSTNKVYLDAGSLMLNVNERAESLNLAAHSSLEAAEPAPLFALRPATSLWLHACVAWRGVWCVYALRGS